MMLARRGRRRVKVQQVQAMASCVWVSLGIWHMTTGCVMHADCSCGGNVKRILEWICSSPIRTRQARSRARSESGNIAIPTRSATTAHAAAVAGVAARVGVNDGGTCRALTCGPHAEKLFPVLPKRLSDETRRPDAIPLCSSRSSRQAPQNTRVETSDERVVEVERASWIESQSGKTGRFEAARQQI